MKKSIKDKDKKNTELSDQVAHYQRIIMMHLEQMNTYNTQQPPAQMKAIDNLKKQIYKDIYTQGSVLSPDKKKEPYSKKPAQ